MKTLIDTRLLKLLPQGEQTFRYLEGSIDRGFNEDLETPSDCERWLVLPGDVGQDITDKLSVNDYCVEQWKHICFVYEKPVMLKRIEQIKEHKDD